MLSKYCWVVCSFHKCLGWCWVLDTLSEENQTDPSVMEEQGTGGEVAEVAGLKAWALGCS